MEFKQADIPKGVLVQCPKRKNSYVRAQRCDTCEHFAGLARIMENEKLAFEQQFLIQCAFPRLTQMHRFDDEASE